MLLTRLTRSTWDNPMLAWIARAVAPLPMSPQERYRESSSFHSGSSFDFCLSRSPLSCPDMNMRSSSRCRCPRIVWDCISHVLNAVDFDEHFLLYLCCSPR